MSNASSADRSLFSAASLLEAVAATAEAGLATVRSTRGALRAATIAVELCLDDLIGADGLAAEVTGESPRLIHATESLEVGLARSLVDLWENEAMGFAPGPGFERSLRRLALQLRHLGNREIDLLWQSLNEPAAHD